MAKKPVVPTPEQIAAGVAKNVNEYSSRVAALRALHSDHTYNPATDQVTLDRAAADAARGSAPGKALPIYAHGGVVEGDIRLGGVDREAVAMAKGARDGRKDEESESPQGGDGDAGVQAGEVAQRFQARPAGAFAQASSGDRHVAVGAVPQVQVFEAESKEALSAKIPAGAVAVTYKRIWRAYVIME